MPHPVFVLTPPKADWLSQSATTFGDRLRRFASLRAVLLIVLLATHLLASSGWAGSLSEHAAPQRSLSSNANKVHPVADYAAWSGHNQDGSWTRAAEYAVGNSELPKLQPADIQQFCPQYRRLPHQQRKQFWVGLLSAMSGPESNFRPASFYQERFHDRKGKPVVSRGLLQISQESANQQRYGCDIRHPSLLHDPVINLACGVRILSLWVKRDQLIASPAGSAPKGGGRYWSTLRHSNGKTAQISDFTRSLAVCQGKPSQQPGTKQLAKQLTSQPAVSNNQAIAKRFQIENNFNTRINDFSNNPGHRQLISHSQSGQAPLKSGQSAKTNANASNSANIGANTRANIRANSNTNIGSNSGANTNRNGGYIRLTGSRTSPTERKSPR